MINSDDRRASDEWQRKCDAKAECDCFAEEGDAHQAYCAVVRDFDDKQAAAAKEVPFQRFVIEAQRQRIAELGASEAKALEAVASVAASIEPLLKRVADLERERDLARGAYNAEKKLGERERGQRDRAWLLLREVSQWFASEHSRASAAHLFKRIDAEIYFIPVQRVEAGLNPTSDG